MMMPVFQKALDLRIRSRQEDTNKVIYIIVNKEDKERTVVIKRHKGRMEVTCSCQNHSRFSGRPVICKHKARAIYQEIGFTILEKRRREEND